MAVTIKKISIIGDGGWGTTLALYLDRRGYDVLLWGAFPQYVEQGKKRGENFKFLPGFKIPRSLVWTSDLEGAIAHGQLVVLATPSQYLSGVLKQIKKIDRKGKVFLSVVKGIEIGSSKRMSELIVEELGRVPLAVLSGPTIASELAAGIVTTAVIASRDQKLAARLQGIFNSEIFRIYTNKDVIGVELGGSVKNVIALACGICDGLGLGTNAKAAVLSRGLAEMTRLGQALGAKKETFAGLTGLGDLVTTCVNAGSRNRSVGEAIGQGKSVEQVLSAMVTVAEGVATAKAVYQLSKKYKVSMPITAEVYNIIYKGKSVKTALASLMSRALKPE